MQFSLLWIILLPSLNFTSARKSSTFHPEEEDFLCTLPNDPPPLTAKMKGLLRGLKYISQMFDEKEPEMQIGLPTDVKHVAHIGMDGPSANKPSWMNEFSAAPELSAVPMNGSPKTKPPAAGNNDSLPPLGNDKPKKSRRKASIGGNGSPIGSPRGNSEKQSRRHRSSNSNLSMESPGRESPSHPRRTHNSSRGTEPSSQELPDVPKKSRRKKSKGSSDGSGSGSSRSRSKGQNSVPDIMELGP